MSFTSTAGPPAVRMLDVAKAGLCDIVDGSRNWRVWHLMGTSELRRRYARSRLGQFWITLSTGVTVVVLGLVWSQLWKISIEQMLPYFAVSFILWTFLSGFVTESASVFIGYGPYYMNQRMSFSTAIFALTHRLLITLAHNLVIVALVLAIFTVPVKWSSLSALLGLVFMTVSGFCLAYLLAMLCTRFRDVTQIVGSAAQLLFFITPVLWTESQLRPEHRWLIDYNPFAILLSIVRNPLMGIEVGPERWIAGAFITLGLFLATILAIGLKGKRIIYWL